MIAGPAGIATISSRVTSMAGCDITVRVIISEKSVRSTASAEPAATLVARAEVRRTEPMASISLFNWPWALAGSTVLNEFVHTSSPR